MLWMLAADAHAQSMHSSCHHFADGRIDDVEWATPQYGVRLRQSSVRLGCARNGQASYHSNPRQCALDERRQDRICRRPNGQRRARQGSVQHAGEFRVVPRGEPVECRSAICRTPSGQRGLQGRGNGALGSMERPDLMRAANRAGGSSVPATAGRSSHPRCAKRYGLAESCNQARTAQAIAPIGPVEAVATSAIVRTVPSPLNRWRASRQQKRPATTAACAMRIAYADAPQRANARIATWHSNAAEQMSASTTRGARRWKNRLINAFQSAQPRERRARQQRLPSIGPIGRKPKQYVRTARPGIVPPSGSPSTRPSARS